MAAKTFLKTALTILFLLIVLVAFPATANAKSIYVDDDATPPGDGTGWETAFTYLQDALMFASFGDEIRVAQGIYKPHDFALSDRPNLVREETFQLINGVTLKGGYAGYSEPDPNSWDIDKYKTVLSGDNNGDDAALKDPFDLLADPSRAENSYHVVTASRTDPSAILDAVVITAGNADSPLFPHCCGAGIYNYQGDPTIINCTFIHNYARYLGGGMYSDDFDYQGVNNSGFIGNFAEYGAGLYVDRVSNTCDPSLINCMFTGNVASKDGGGICSGDSCVGPILINCTLSSNSAGHKGGGMYGSDCSVMNCIFWGNSDSGGQDETAQVGESDYLVVNYSCIQGWTGVLSGTGTIGNDPLFIDADGADNVPGTDDDNLRLSPGSPCIDAADNTKVPESVVIDLDGNPRFIDDLATPNTGNPPSDETIIDMGAYESPNRGFLLSIESVYIPEGGTAMFTVALVMDPLRSVNVTVAPQSGDPDITVISGASLIFDSSNYFIPQTVKLSAAEDCDNLNGTAIILINAVGLFTAQVSAIEQDNDPVLDILYVDDTAPGVNNGSSWAQAYTDLQDALTTAAAFSKVKEIRVALGLYMPAGPSGDREASFQLVNGVTLKGGFAGFGRANPDARNIKAYETILSGDLNGDDTPDFANYDENSYHVVTGSGTDRTSVLDGFTVTGGNASGRWTTIHRCGGGMYNRFGGPTVSNCTFVRNQARTGGGMYNERYSFPKVTNCRFIRNSIIDLNHAGGAVFNGYSSITLSYCIFIENSARDGGGVCNSTESVCRLTNCTFIGNSATEDGGGLCDAYGDRTPVINSCLFMQNSANRGGALYCSHSSPTITNCTFAFNSAFLYGGGMYGGGIITNCIFSGNSDNEGMDESAQLDTRWDKTSINYSCIQRWTGHLGGLGNHGEDPLFVDADGDDNIAGTEDDNLHLLPDSPCIDAGDPDYVAEPNEKDLDGNPRVINGRIDMGAYEYSALIQADIRIIPRTINLRSKGQWIAAFIRIPEDYNVTEIDPNSIFLENEIQPDEFSVDEQQQVATAKFNRENVQAILGAGDIDLKITGRLTDGTVFEATDTIKVIDKAGKN
jgi:parallel beta-helix repeat protein/predicted outer membrane repeat protein